MARRPPARAVVPYWASAAAALPAAVGEAEGVDEESEEEPLVDEGELLAEAEPELPALPALVASVVVRLPQRLSRAWMHWNWAASSEPVAAMHWSYQTRHMRPGTVCWYSLITLVMEVPFRHSHPNWRVCCASVSACALRQRKRYVQSCKCCLGLQSCPGHRKAQRTCSGWQCTMSACRSGPRSRGLPSSRGWVSGTASSRSAQKQSRQKPRRRR